MKNFPSNCSAIFRRMLLVCLILTTTSLFITQRVSAQYCAAKGPKCSKAGNSWIKGVNLSTGFSKTSTCVVTPDSLGYSNFTNDTMKAVPGTTVTLTVTPENPALTDYMSVFIDFNRDGDFADAGEEITVADTPGARDDGVYTVDIDIPATAKVDSVTRIRIRTYDRGVQIGGPVGPCGNTSYGEVEDYSFQFVSQIATSPSYCAASGNPGCVYRFSPDGGTTFDSSYYYIEKVEIENDNTLITNSSVCDGYGDYTNITAVVSSGLTYSVYVYSNSPVFTDEQAAVFVDWNNDFDFDDADEVFYGNTGLNPFLCNVVVPANAKVGPKRMRVRTSFVDLIPNDCGVQQGGEVEDYTLFVNSLLNPLPNCNPVDSCSPKLATSVCMSQDSLRWKRVAGATGYIVSLVDLTTGTVVVNKDTVTSLSYPINALLSVNTDYRWIANPYNATGEAYACDSIFFSTYPNPDPVVNFIPGREVTVCKGVIQNISGNPLNGESPFTHSWDGFQLSSNSLLSDTAIQDPDFVSSVPGSFRYEYIVRDVNGCTGRDTITITVSDGPSGDEPVAEESNLCLGSDLVIYTKDKVGTIDWTMVMQNANGTYVPVILDEIDAEREKINLTKPGDYYFKGTLHLDGCSRELDVVKATIFALPVKPIISPSNLRLCVGESGYLKVINPAGNLLWSDRNGTTSTSLLVNSNAIYTVTVTDPVSGCSTISNEASVTLVEAPVKPVIEIIGQTPACKGGTVVLRSNYPMNNRWSNGVYANELSVTESGLFSVTHSNDIGCSSTSAIVEVVMYELPIQPTINRIGTGPLCVGDETKLICSPSAKYLWNTGETTREIKINTGGVYSVTITNENNCSSTSGDYTYLFNAKPTKPIISITTKEPFCEGNEMKLISTPAFAYLWNTGENTENVIQTSSGVYSVKVLNDKGCSSVSDDFMLNLNPNPVPPILTASGPLCKGTPAIINSSYSSGNLWSNGLTTSEIEITFNQELTVVYTDNNNCTSKSDVFVAIFNEIPNAPVINQFGKKLFAAGDGATSYNWFDEAGAIENEHEQFIAPLNGGNYFATIVNLAGCESPRSAGYFYSGTGIQSLNKEEYKVYPNPSNGSFEVLLQAASQTGEYQLHDVSGRLLYQGQLQNQANRITTQLAPGTYLLKITVNGLQTIERLIIY